VIHIATVRIATHRQFVVREHRGFGRFDVKAGIGLHMPNVHGRLRVPIVVDDGIPRDRENPRPQLVGLSNRRQFAHSPFEDRCCQILCCVPVPNANHNIAIDHGQQLLVGARELLLSGWRLDCRQFTEWGAQLEPVVTELARWSSRSPSMPYDGPIGVDSLILSLRPLFDPHVAVGVDTRVGIRLDGQDFRVHVADGRLEVSRGEAEFPAATLVTDRVTFAALLWRRQRLSEAVKAGSAHVSGNSALLNRFLRMFSLPEPVAAMS
jgi:hypothetical protein